MAFLDNSGDIILDAVLTDTGRLRLAQGDGSFKISKFALGDDEINYELYNKSHASGSAYYDLEILQTPVLEAFTNNTSNLKTKLVSISRTNILFMPVLGLNKNDKTSSSKAIQAAPSTTFSRSGASSLVTDISDNKFYVAVDQKTYTALGKGRTASAEGDATLRGVIEGFQPTTTTDGSPAFKDLIRVDQGMDTNQISPEIGLDSDLLETAYIVEMDYRLGRVKGVQTSTPHPVNFIDDDNIASYYLTTGFINPEGTISGLSGPGGSKLKGDLTDTPVIHEGPRGSTLQFRIHASQELNSSTYLFTQLGYSEPIAGNADNILGFKVTDSLVANGTIHYLDSTIRVTGANTGYRLDIPVRYVKVDY